MSLYLAASLPLLQLGQEPPLSSAGFLFSCQGQLGPEELESLGRLLGQGPERAGQPAPQGAPDFERAWRAVDARLRAEAAAWRTQGKDAASNERPYAAADQYAAHLAKEALAKEDPLQRERALDEARMKLLDELVGVDAFSLAAVLAYGVRLTLAERWARLAGPKAADQGRQALDGYVDAYVDGYVQLDTQSIPQGGATAPAREGQGA